ncbi:MAG TPA: hypothetical protein VFR33_09425 [Candidatus Dormibacteraeota bacterium]|nr:hypothetical protein [Candidatus Dormibacteraeota bacterium]
MTYRRLLLAAIGSIAAVALTGAPALASDTGYHQNPNANVNGACHGAFGAFSHHFIFSPGFVPPVDAHQDIGSHGGGSATNPNAEGSESSDAVC